MAKKAREAEETLDALSPDTSAQDTGNPVINTEEPSGKMSKKEAEAIVKKYAGINGVRIPELEAARKVLKG